MRALIIAFVCIALTISTWLLFLNHADESLHQMSAIVEKKVYTEVDKGQWQEAEKDFEQFTDKWHDHKDIYSLFLDHSIIAETDFSIARTKDYIKSKSTALSLAELSCIKEQLKLLHQNEMLSFDNVF